MIIILGAGIVFLLVILVIYNGLIAKKNAVQNAFSTVDVQLKQRHDLIPNLVATLQQFMKHEKSTLENIVALRSQAMQPQMSPSEKVAIENKISSSLGSIMVAVEAYPQLKADTNFVSLQRSLNETEAQIAAARRSFNAAVTEFNNAIEMFPSSLLASAMGYKQAELIIASEGERKNVDVKALFNS
jgi:LemA protein